MEKIYMFVQCYCGTLLWNEGMVVKGKNLSEICARFKIKTQEPFDADAEILTLGEDGSPNSYYQLRAISSLRSEDIPERLR